MSCADGDKGQLLAEMAINSTANLKPQYEYSPWVVVDGKPIKEDAYSLKEYVCDAYQGALPLECSPAMLKDYYPRKSTLRGKHVQRLQGKHSSKLHSADGKLDSAVQRDLSLEASEQSHGGAAEGARSRHSTKGHVQALMGRGSFFQKCLPDMH